MILLSTSTKSVFQFLSVLLIFIFVLAITYFTTRWVAKIQQNVQTNKNIRVIETFKVTNNKYIQIIEIGRKYLAVSICKDTIHVLTELEEDQLTWISGKDGIQTGSGKESFQEILKKLREKIPKK